MTQLIAVLSFMLISFGAAWSQDLPPLPPMDNSQAAAPAGTTPSASSSSTMPALPPLPASGNSSTAGTLPPLPSSDATSTSAMPPLPNSGNSSTAGTMPPLPNSGNSSTAGTMPALPASSAPAPDNSQATTNWSSPSLQPSASGPASAPAVPGVPKAKVVQPRKMTPAQKYRAEHDRPNVIYGGWVWPKGREVDDKLAWTSQEVLNALVPHGFTVTKEEGNYDGEDATTPQWRQWTFSIDHSDVVTQVYIKPIKHRIWMRIGPSEAPADRSLSDVKAIQAQDLRMLKLLRHQLGQRLTPHHRNDWTARYNYKAATADE